MYFGISPVAVRPVFQPRPYVRPASQIVNRTVYTPGPVQTRYLPGQTITRYNTIVRPDYGAVQRAREAQSNWDRERFNLERTRHHDRNAEMRYNLLQQQLYQAQMAAQQQPTVPPPAMVQNMPQPMPTVQPGSPAVDLTPQQDASAAAQDSGGGDGGGAPSHKPKHLMLFVGLIGVAAVGGYLLMKKKSSKKSSD
jgi:hypothetical protein